MVKKVFTVGDLVFAKVKGYPAWPARVTGKTLGGKYSVFFYGTFEVGNMKPEEVWPYNEKTRERFGPVNMRKKWYSEGLYQIEHTPEIAFEQVGGAGDGDRDGGGIEGDGGVAVPSGLDQGTEPVLVKVLSSSELKEVHVSPDHLLQDPGQLQLTTTTTKMECQMGTVRRVLQAGDGGLLDTEVRKEMKKEVERAMEDHILERKKEVIKWLKTEQRLVELVWQIQKCMSSSTPDMAKCVEMLELMEAVDIEPLMVIKLPEVFTTVRKLSRMWQGGSGCLAQEIRERSERVNEKIVTAFDWDKSSSLDEFNEHFEKKVSEFKETTSGLEDKERLILTNMDYS